MGKFLRFVKDKIGLVGIIIGSLVVGGVSTVAVMAAIPNSQTGQINGCYRTQGGLLNQQGSLRVIDAQSGQNCGNNELPLNWNQTGPAGPQGPQGPPGSSNVITNRVQYARNPANPQAIINISGIGPLALQGDFCGNPYITNNSGSSLGTADGAAFTTDNVNFTNTLGNGQSAYLAFYSVNGFMLHALAGGTQKSAWVRFSFTTLDENDQNSDCIVFGTAIVN
jgi:hypothetical protein